MIRVVEGSLSIVDDLGNTVSTISGVNGSALQIKEQNTNSDGHIQSTAHTYGQYNGAWSPFSVDDQGRLRIVSEDITTPHTLSGILHTGLLSDEQIPTYITRDSELSNVSGALQTNIDGKSDLGHIHDDRYYTESEIDGMLVSCSGLWDSENDILFPASNGITVSGIGDLYCDNLYGSTTTPIESIIYVSKNGNDSNTGTISDPFLTIQSGINYAKEHGVVAMSKPAEIRIFPGVYEESITDTRWNLYLKGGYANQYERERSVVIYNTGADEAHYPLNCDGLKISGITIRTDPGGVFGKIRGMYIKDCYFQDGHFIENDSVSSLYMDIRSCLFGSSGFKLADSTGVNKYIALRDCDLYGASLEFGSDQGTVKFQNSMISSTVTVSGGWSTILEKSSMSVSYTHLTLPTKRIV